MHDCIPWGQLYVRAQTSGEARYTPYRSWLLPVCIWILEQYILALCTKIDEPSLAKHFACKL